ncbi:O-antigen ligase family protein [Pyxidicoccus parkwayensis]|uniref:O-antigen ligase family protein n=1 Tax=Pyxidicoccus parkwayensis TaxID=2813578 RepID=A0ABX7NVZ1_9BACT|nr:exopolysaccharide repeat unit polymerase [Pyxidicoccus parkwaysis]QSQ21556.1 O-antigen ligase family protein [Pyxidicoccus parkwaysis]
MYSPERPPYLRYLALIGFLVLATVGGGVIHPVVAVAPVLAVTVLWVILKVPIRYPVFAVTYLTLAVDYVAERPQSGLWESPLHPLGELLFAQLSYITKIGALRFPLIDVLVVGLMGLAMYRKVTKSTIDPPTPPMPRPLVAVTTLSLIALLWMEVRGVARGGDFKQSLWQWHQAAMMPFIVAMYHYSLRGPQDWPTLCRVVIAAGITKALVGSYFALVIVKSLGVFVEYTTAHSDSMTFIFCLLVVMLRFIEKPKAAHIIRGLGVVIIILMGMVFNDRRLAYVSLVGCLLAAFLINPWTPLKRFVVRMVPFLAPVIAVYIAIGWNHPTGIFGPVDTIRSLIDGQGGEGNLDYRDIENLDLIATWAQFPLLGTGYGHEFLLPVPLPDIAFVFPQFRYHPHDSLLGLFAFGGMLGYTGVWMYLAVTVFMAVRAYHRSDVSEHRACALIIVGIVASYINQVFGDMGIISYICTFLISMCVAMSGKLAVLSGAWPMPNSALLAMSPAAPVPPPGAIAYPNADGAPTPSSSANYGRRA